MGTPRQQFQSRMLDLIAAAREGLDLNEAAVAELRLIRAARVATVETLIAEAGIKFDSAAGTIIRGLIDTLDEFVSNVDKKISLKALRVIEREATYFDTARQRNNARSRIRMTEVRAQAGEGKTAPKPTDNLDAVLAQRFKNNEIAFKSEILNALPEDARSDSTIQTLISWDVLIPVHVPEGTEQRYMVVLNDPARGR